MIILHFHLQPQFKNELFLIYFTSFQIKARFTDNIRQERVPFTDITITKGILKIISTRACGFYELLLFFFVLS